ncbi:MAG TPA: GNAT family N-acetyltransferase [Burkholderiaceae bacterium]|nr:GNAT family N-acetyltransferase [Burkholderiaceae bacterium]
MQVLWSGHDRAQWDAWHRTAAAALQQDWAYGEAMQSGGVRCLRARVQIDGRTVAIAQFIGVRVALLVSTGLCSRGPVFLEPLEALVRAQVYRALKRSVPLPWPRALFFTPDEPGGSASGVHRLQRVMTGYATVLIDLERSLDELRAAMHPKWRNRLAAAERAGLTVQRVGARAAQYRWLLEREEAQRKGRGYLALPTGFVESYQALKPSGADALLTLRIDAGREPAAAMMFLIHGEAASYHIGWTGEKGRELDAHNLLLWHAMTLLKQKGVRRLDLGGVNTASGAGIARFKIGSGGAVVQFAGTYF